MGAPKIQKYSMILLCLALGLAPLPPAGTVFRSAYAQAPTQEENGSPNRLKRIPLKVDIGSIIAEEQSRIRNSKPQGEPVSVELFGGKAEGRTFVFIVDRSKSMRLGTLALAEQRLFEAIRDLKPHHRFQVIAYHHECRYISERKLIPATDENKQAVVGFLKDLPAVGTTEHEMALLSALRHAPDALFLLTDGGYPELTDKQIARLSKLAGTRTAIHCVQFGYQRLQEPKEFLKKLAEQNRGTFTYVDASRFMTEPR